MLFLSRRGLSLELSLAIVFFTNVVLSLGALIYIVTGINTDLFLWARDYLISLKDEDSAVNAKVSSPRMSASSCLWMLRGEEGMQTRNLILPIIISPQ